MKISSEFVKFSMMAGVAISLGGVAYLSTGNALLFPIGLLIVCVYRLYLFTGKVGYFGSNEGHFKVWELFAMWVFNTIGAYLTGIIVGVAKPELIDAAVALRDKKLDEGFLKLILLGVLCNVMIFLAVDAYKWFSADKETLVVGVFALFAFTSTFVFCGFEHCVANAFYFGLAGSRGSDILELAVAEIVFLFVNALANAVGGLMMRWGTSWWSTITIKRG